MNEYEQEYFDFCLEAMVKGHVITSAGRQMLKYGDRQVPLHRALWNFCYQDDPVLSTEVIHHKNECHLDNRIENLEKMSAGEHNQLHVERVRQLRIEGKPYPFKLRGPSKRPKKKNYERKYPDSY